MNHELRGVAERDEEVRAVYRSLVRDVEARDGGVGPASPVTVAPIADHLSLPLDLWNDDRKPTRTVPTLAAYDHYVELDDGEDLRRILVGLDVLVTMLDEFIDSAQADSDDRLRLAVNVAFASLLSFGSIPDDADGTTELLLDYLVEAARIPSVEHGVQRELDAISAPDRAMELLRFAYAYRARDISVFGRLPALHYDVDERTADRIVSDLETCRAHYLLFDDVRDVRQDARNGIETPVLWLLRTRDDVDDVMDRLVEIYRTFEYAETPYRSTLRELEREPENLREELVSAMEIVR